MLEPDHLEPPAGYLAVYGRPLGGGAAKKAPSATMRRQILERQHGSCLYCGLLIGAKVLRGWREVTLRLNWDHFIPHAYLAANPTSNWVAACHVCNRIKGSRMFDTVIEAQQFLRGRRLELGYSRSAIIETSA
jgi:hypothetical protein